MKMALSPTMCIIQNTFHHFFWYCNVCLLRQVTYTEDEVVEDEEEEEEVASEGDAAAAAATEGSCEGR